MTGTEHLPTNPAAHDDNAVRRFRTYLLAERNASDHTAAGYEQDIAQFAAFRWGADAPAPFDWTRVSPEDARRFLMAFAGDGAKDLLEEAFAVKAEDNVCVVPKLVSRKKQLIPGISAMLQN